jgi:hypothetical protein
MIELPDFAGHADALWNALLDLEGPCHRTGC